MKRISFILLLCAMSIFISCSKDSNTCLEKTGNLKVAVDVQTSFDNDKVEISIDDENLINRHLTTNNLLGVCPLDGQIIATRSAGNHEIKVTINNALSKTGTFELADDLYIGIQYSRQTNEITIVYSPHRFLYD